MSYAWQPELFVCFRKGIHFLEALEDAFVPCDPEAIGEAHILWGNWSAGDQFADLELQDRYARATR